jgi:hypothetical protein
VDRAKKAGERVPLAVEAAVAPERGGHAPAAEAVLVLVGGLVRGRTDAEWRVLDALDRITNRRQVAAAKMLGISPQAVSKAILRSGWQEEQGGRAAAELLLAHADA